MKKGAKIILVVALGVILLGIGLWMGAYIARSQDGVVGGVASSYSAVYLTNGDVYFGVLHHFPAFYLSDAYVFERATDANDQTSMTILPFKNLFWDPAGDIYLNPVQILFTAPLRAGSSIVGVLANPSPQESNQIMSLPASSGGGQ